jgi:hypothetical protein
MNSIKTYLLLSIIMVIVASCDDPIPIEISNEIEEEAEITIVNSEPASYVITGYDSTGIIDEEAKTFSLISFNGIKNTFDKITYYKAFAEAVFVDTSKPILNSSNRLVGYNTVDVSRVKFNDQPAIKLPFYLRYRDNFVERDSLVGTRHARLYNAVLRPENLNFRYDSELSVTIESEEGNVSNVNLRVPREIVGNVTATEGRGVRKKRIFLSWNRLHANPNSQGDYTEEIIIGGKYNNRNELVPLLRLRRLKSNIFEIPNSLVEDILESDQFDYLVFSFLRKKTIRNSVNQLGEIRFATQSIHNIWIKL